MENFGWTTLSAIISASIIFIVQRVYRTSDLKEIEKFKSDIQKEREVFLSKIKLTSELQLKLYNELWVNLSDLESIVEDLWENGATPTGVKTLAKIVKSTDKKIKDSALIIETNDFQRLNKILDTLKNYQAGKIKLLALEDVDQNTSNEIQRQIEQNFDLRSQYVDLKNEMFVNMKERISVS